MTNHKNETAKFLAIAVQFGLLVLLFHGWRLEGRAFYHNIMIVALLGFVVHNLLPIKHRLFFFLLLSLFGIVSVLGLQNGIWLITIGVVLIGICHLTIPYLVRVVLLIAAGAVLGALRLSWINAPWSSVIWPVLGSMFMFRLIVYLYDLKHSRRKPSISRTLSYFFLLPNITFPLFPVVDYNTFQRTYYDRDKYKIYQTGIAWMFRGATHLILYRVVNYYFVCAPEDVFTAADLVRYLVTNFLLYLRVSGQFHLVIGLLHLFGFDLPETNHRYLLASGVTDLWRRINIYWKDFMLKVFYYPAYFRARRLGDTIGMVLATLFVFFITWFLHAYQWFWIRGSFLLAWQDILFWAIVAVLVVANSLYEATHPKRRSLRKHSNGAREMLSLVLQVVATFGTVCILWSLWTSSSLSEWFSLLSAAGNEPGQLIKWAGIVAVLAVIVYGLALGFSRLQISTIPPSLREPTFYRSAAINGSLIALLYLLGTAPVLALLGEKPEELIRDLSRARLSDRDAAMLQRGYYEQLMGVNRLGSELWEIQLNKPDEWRTLKDSKVVRFTGDFLSMELLPSVRSRVSGAGFTTNRWGMRDKEYNKEKAANTYRIALLGSSHAMGAGVSDNETFESLLEDRLNRENDGKAIGKYEILNFGVSAYDPIRELMVLENKALPFEPDAVFYLAQWNEKEFLKKHMVEMISLGVDIPYDSLGNVIQRAGIETKTPPEKMKRRLSYLTTRILAWTYRRIVDDCRQHDILPCWIFLPTINPKFEIGKHPDRTDNLFTLATDAGFTVFDLSDIYFGQDVETIRVAEWDWHPNAKGHELIANELFEAIKRRGGLATMPIP